VYSGSFEPEMPPSHTSSEGSTGIGPYSSLRRLTRSNGPTAALRSSYQPVFSLAVLNLLLAVPQLSKRRAQELNGSKPGRVFVRERDAYLLACALFTSEP
jgi:hypothetical protein